MARSVLLRPMISQLIGVGRRGLVPEQQMEIVIADCLLRTHKQKRINTDVETRNTHTHTHEVRKEKNQEEVGSVTKA